MSDSRDAYADDFGFAPDDAGRRDPERRLFHLKSLYDTSRELADPAPPQEVLRRFLPMAMGPLGSTFGFAIFLHTKGLAVESLGLSETARNGLAESGEILIRKFFPEGDAPPARAVIMAGHHLSEDPNLAHGTSMVAALPVDEEALALLGFGTKIDGTEYGDDETALLRGMASLLTAALRKGCSEACINDLNHRLQHRNRQLEEVLGQAEQTREKLARRAFELQALFETASELSALNEPDAILDAFTLSVMGTLGYSGGWVAIYGHGENDMAVSYRGPNPEDRDRLASGFGRNEILARFVDLKDRMPHAHQCRLLQDKEALDRLPVPTDAAVLFTLDHGWRGAVGLSSPCPERHCPNPGNNCLPH